MFYVYGVSGQSFRGSMEQLRQIPRIGASARTDAIKPVKRDGADPAYAEAQANAGEPVASEPINEARRAALVAYTQTQNPILQRNPMRRVDDLMSRQVTSIADSATVLDGWHLLARHGVGQAPVVNSAGMLVGLLCRGDLLSPDRLPTPDSHPLVWHALMAQNVTDIMVSPVPSVSPDADIRWVASVLLDTGLPGLAVVDEQGVVAGFVSRSDILRAVVTEPPLDLWG
jgi:CBS-domain-containing membrane protein